MPSWRTGSGVYTFFTVTGETTFYQNTAGYMSGILVQPGMGAAQREAPSGELFDGSIPDGADPILGTADGSFGFASSGQGLRRVAGALTAAFGYMGTASGTVDSPVTQVDGIAQASLGGAGSAVGVITKIGTASVPLGGAGSAAGVITKTGAASTSLGGAAAGTGVSGVVGFAAATFGGSASIAGVRRGHGTAAASLGLLFAAIGQRRASGVATLQPGPTAGAAGQASRPSPGRVNPKTPTSPGNLARRASRATPGSMR